MTKEDIKDRIEKLEYLEFLLSMKDRWSDDDYAKSWERKREIRELKNSLDD